MCPIAIAYRIAWDCICHRNNDDCLEGKRKNNGVCSMQYCVQQLCTVQCTHMNRPNSCLLVRFSFLPAALRTAQNTAI